VSDKPKISMAEMLKNKQQSLAKNKFKSQLGAGKGKTGAKQR
jgi:hypothetical protein